MKTKHFTLLCLLSAGIFSSCAEIDKLNDYNKVESFVVTDHKAAGGGIIVLGDITVVEEGEIHIGIEDGVLNFPLMFKGEPRFANPIDRVTGIDFSDWVTIDLQRDEGEPVMVNGRYTFEELRFYVQAVSGLPREYVIKIDHRTGGDVTYEDFWQFESWADDYTPLPAGTKDTPYWASANMKSVITIANTYRTAGDTGEGSAVMLETVDAVLKKASGSLFLGWFDSSNALEGFNDPVILTFQGIPFVSDKQIRGMEADILYSPGAGAGSDTGTLAMELIRWRNSSGDFVYHGKRPDGTPHPDNNADMVARGRVLVGTQAGVQNGEEIRVVPDNIWVKRVFVPLEYDGTYPQYTHLGITFASSSQGDSFIAEPGTVMKVDNVRLVYDE